METIRNFVREELDKFVVQSDVQLIDKFIRKHYISMFKNVNYGMIGKKAESIRKCLSEMRKKGKLRVENRIYIPITNTHGGLKSQEIFYSLNLDEGKKKNSKT